jgi:DtxR family Mn-dependent transcriptional regulator
VTTSKNITSTTNMSVRLSMAMENYLLSIFRLQEEGFPVTITLLAEHLKTVPRAEGLGTSLPTVASMVKRMEREGFLKIDTKNKKVVFTTAGFTNAETIVRRHRLAERLVVDLFGVELYRAHTEAHLLEHAISPYLETKILAKLGNPSISPYGYPIPGSGYVINKKALKLSKSPINANFIVDRISVDDQSLLKYLVENNITPGQTGSISGINESAGTISINCSGSEAVFSLSVGDLIWVIPN